MKIDLKKITVRELSEKYTDNNEDGVTGYGSKLDIRPIYQREFVYKEEQRKAVIDTVMQGFPINVMYWSVREGGKKFEIIDGQQRTISICQYIAGDFSYNERYFANLQDDEKNKILDYELMIYMCSGKDSERLKWFETINIAGEELTPQEIRNAVYSGTWVTDAKKYFSKRGCVASAIADDYMRGSAIRQEYLETAIKWVSKNKITDYMAKRQDKNADGLRRHFDAVIEWIETTFPDKRSKLMQKVDWGPLYDKYKNATLNPKKIEKEICKLLSDEDVTKQDGIYPYILTRNEKYISIRTFSEQLKRRTYERQKGVCKICNEHFELSEMEADHIKPWSKGGRTIESNCQMLCKEDNGVKSGK